MRSALGSARRLAQLGGSQLLGLTEGRLWAYLLLAPAMILVLAVVIYPVGSGILMSFREMRLVRPDLGTPFVGLRHYFEMLDDPIFWVALRNTAVWVGFGLLGQFGLGLITALALNRPVVGVRLARVLLLLPWLMPSVVAAHMWALMLNPRLGVINDILVRVGLLSAPRDWFVNPSTGFAAAILVETWRSTAFFTLLLLAGLQAIPGALYEAAEVDGANVWQQFWRITLPLLMPVIVATSVLRVIGLVNSPDVLQVLTHGGPGNATQVLSLYAYQTAYSMFDFGYAAALSVVMLLLLMAFTVVYVKITRVAED